jgi:hypothetical protein
MKLSRRAARYAGRPSSGSGRSAELAHPRRTAEPPTVQTPPLAGRPLAKPCEHPPGPPARARGDASNSRQNFLNSREGMQAKQSCLARFICWLFEKSSRADLSRRSPLSGGVAVAEPEDRAWALQRTRRPEKPTRDDRTPAAMIEFPSTHLPTRVPSPSLSSSAPL